MLKIENVSKKFGNHKIFENINLEFENGDLVHFFGPNGSGKSTLFKIIADIMSPDTGKITIPEDKRIGAVIENPGFIENETILYNLKYLYTLLNEYNEEVEKKLENLCKQFNLDLYNKNQMKDYSVGMRQKTAIIQAIMEDQDIILLDEPTRGLDTEGVEQFYKTIKEYNKNKDKIIIIASHDLMDNLDFNKKLVIEDCGIYDKLSKKTK
jgi:ABC-2 type transport system ATP-binding protein